MAAAEAGEISPWLLVKAWLRRRRLGGVLLPGTATQPALLTLLRPWRDRLPVAPGVRSIYDSSHTTSAQLSTTHGAYVKAEKTS
ncbi:hypothetical protein AOLI_G00206100 [Acnodon oligacanthus]